jgi:hypothetical protein
MVATVSSRWIRVCAFRAVIAVVLVLTTRMARAGPAIPEVRSTNPVIRALLAEAISGSRTFRRLVETIERSDGIVYVESGTCGHGAQACLAISVTPASGYRILRILLNTRRRPLELMESIGHELHHAVEVLTNPALINTAAIYFFYAQESGMVNRSFETAGAIQAGFAVRRELKASLDAAARGSLVARTR